MNDLQVEDLSEKIKKNEPFSCWMSGNPQNLPSPKSQVAF